MAVAAVVCSLAVCTMTGCTGKATEQEAAQAVSTENTTEGTILTAEDIKASGQNASASADVDEVADHPAGEKSQEKEDSVPESGTTEEAPETEPKQETEVSVDKETSGNKTSGSSQGSTAGNTGDNTQSNTQGSAGSAPTEQPQITETQAQSGSTSSTPAAPAAPEEAAPSLPAEQEQTTVQVPVENQQSQTTEPQPATCTHNWQPVTHEETVCTQPEYDEQITEERVIARDGTDLTDIYNQGTYYDENGNFYDPFGAVILEHGGSWSFPQVVVDTIHHDAVYVTETVFDYYECPDYGLKLGEASYNRIYGNQQ